MTSRKDDIGFHYVLKQAAIYSYRGNNSRLPHGYRVIESVVDGYIRTCGAKHNN